MERRQPASVKQGVVHVVGEDNQLMIDMVGAQELHQARRLCERHIAIIVAMDEQDRGLPLLDLRNRR